MEQGRIKIGMKVLVTGLETTHASHNSCQDMRNMVGKKYTVHMIRNAEDFLTGISSSMPKGAKAITLYDGGNGFVWAPEDLEYAGPPFKLPKKETFNPDNNVRI